MNKDTFLFNSFYLSGVPCVDTVQSREPLFSEDY